VASNRREGQASSDETRPQVDRYGRCHIREPRPLSYGWFPSNVEYQSYTNEVLKTQETLTVEVEQFNWPIPEDVFEFVGMAVPVGREVYDFSGETAKTMRLTTNGLVEETSEPVPEVPRDSAATRRIILLVNGVAFAVIAMWLVWRKSAGRRVGSSSDDS